METKKQTRTQDHFQRLHCKVSGRDFEWRRKRIWEGMEGNDKGEGDLCVAVQAAVVGKGARLPGKEVGAGRKLYEDEGMVVVRALQDVVEKDLGGGETVEVVLVVEGVGEVGSERGEENAQR